MLGENKKERKMKHEIDYTETGFLADQMMEALTIKDLKKILKKLKKFIKTQKIATEAVKRATDS